MPQPLHCPRVNCIPNIGDVIAHRDAPLSHGYPAPQSPCDPSGDTGYAEKGSLLYHSLSLAKIVYCLRFCNSALTSARLSEKNNMIISILCIKKSGEPVKT